MWPFTRKALPKNIAEVEQKSLTNPTPVELSIFGGTVPGRLSVDRALTVPAVSAAIRLIAESAATLDITVKKREGDQEVDVPDHPAAQLLRGEANGWTSGFELIRDLTTQALIHDNGGLAYVVKVARKPREVIHYRPSYLQVDYDQASGEPSYKLDNQPVDAASVIHVRGPFAKSPLNMAIDAISAAKYMEEHASGLFANAARPGGLLKSKTNMGKDQVENVKSFWAAANEGGKNSGKTAFMPFDLEFQQMAFTSTDSQFVENRVFAINEVARAFRVPPGKIYEMSRQTWSNLEAADRDFISTSLEPWLRALESAFNRSLLTDAERKTHRIAFDRDDASRADLSSRATSISTLVSAKVLNPNEARDWLGMAPYAGGDKFENPNVGTKPVTQPNGGKPPPETRNDNQDARAT